MNLSDLLPVILPVLPEAVDHIAGLVTERLPRKLRPLVPIVIGAGLGLAGQQIGLNPYEVGLITAAGGPGAAAWHRFIRGGGKVVPVSTPGTTVDPSSLPPKP